ncbi:uncharacterized protein METZ01_LOCUS162817, partial [marine metagenome]
VPKLFTALTLKQFSTLTVPVYMCVLSSTSIRNTSSTYTLYADASWTDVQLSSNSDDDTIKDNTGAVTSGCVVILEAIDCGPSSPLLSRQETV